MYGKEFTFSSPSISKSYRSLYICDTCGSAKQKKPQSTLLSIWNKSRGRIRPKLIQRLNEFYRETRTISFGIICHGDFQKIILNRKISKSTNTDLSIIEQKSPNQIPSGSANSSTSLNNEIIEGQKIDNNNIKEIKKAEIKSYTNVSSDNELNNFIEPVNEIICNVIDNDKLDYSPYSPLDIKAEMVDVGYAIRDDIFGFTSPDEIDFDTWFHSLDNIKGNIKNRKKRGFEYYDDSDNSLSNHDDFSESDRVLRLVKILNSIENKDYWLNAYDENLEFENRQDYVHSRFYVQIPTTIFEEYSQTEIPLEPSDSSASELNDNHQSDN